MIPDGRAGGVAAREDARVGHIDLEAPTRLDQGLRYAFDIRYSRRAVQRADDVIAEHSSTVVRSDYFDELLAALDEAPEASPVFSPRAIPSVQ